MNPSRRYPLRVTLGLLLPIVLLVQCQKPTPMNRNPVIALITDFGQADAYVPQMKGAILTLHPSARILDLTHELEAFNLHETSYLLAKSASTLPPGTIICAVVDPGVGSDRHGVALQTNSGRTYIGPDNGIFSHVLAQEGLAAAVILDNTDYFRGPHISHTFHGRDIFGPVAAHLARGVSLNELGTPTRELTDLKLERPAALGSKITGRIVHIDHYGNVITNIHRVDLPDNVLNNLVKVVVNGRTLTLPFVETYADGPEKRLFALFNSDNEFELAIKEGSAAKTIQPKIGESLVIRLK